MAPQLSSRSKRRLSRLSPLLASAGALLLWAGASLVGCSSNEQLPPRSMGTGVDAGDPFDAGGGGGPPEVDASGYCGNEVHQAIIDSPNLYFVLDASGSMDADVPGQAGNRYDAVRMAVVDLARKLGPLVKVGAAVFPQKDVAADACGAGAQVFPVTQGDPVTGEDGPTTTGLRLATARIPSGGTPIASTLEAITPTLLALAGETYVVLATDGGPNCNSSAVCDASSCMLNIEGPCSLNGASCCAPDDPTGGPSFCVDTEATVTAIQTLAVAGLHLSVVGIPGSETYATVLDTMALTAGSTKPSSPFYFQVSELGDLYGVLSEIAKVAVKCEFVIADPPSEKGNTNVYLDEELLPYNDQNGWFWKLPWTVTLVGDACDRLKAGLVKQVQIVSGCPTEMPK